ncbi:MAG: hypothetical protein HOE90_23570 [Bacteriovoracaceae bacterium]|nr:hypothetical protein [Bacteriovoracaceae bacterium]
MSLISDNQSYIDITPVISESMGVFPGDCSFSRDVVLSFEKGDNLVLSSIKATAHLGAHTDAPNHYHPDGVSIEKRSLNYYMGPCQVIEVPTAKGQRIELSDFEDQKIVARRVLFKTNSYVDPNNWSDDFCSLSVSVIEYLNQHKVRLVGIDTPSVDPCDSKDLPAHHAIYKNDMAILEGVVLTDVVPGIYTLLALPLAISGGDASPVRAILLSEGNGV